MPCCCMNNTGLAAPNETAAGYWGNSLGCDLPLWTYEETLRQIAANHGSELDFAFFTGDSPPHDIWQQSKESNFAHTQALVEKWKQYLPNVPLYVCMGNHESYPVNEFPTSTESSPDWDGEWLYGGYGDLIAEYLTPEALATFRENGFYSIRPQPNLKIISVNNNFGFQ